MQTLLLVGGGLTHALLLRHAQDLPVKLVLITPERFAPYGGMLPELVAGHYRFRDCHIDLAKLCDRAGARLVCSRVDRLDLHKRQALLTDGQSLDFDLISLSCGTESSLPPEARDHCLSIKPISQFLPAWQQALERLYLRHKGANLAVVGGGVLGVELAMAISHRLEQDPRITAPVDIHLVHTGGSLLPDQPLAVQLHATRQLHERHIRVHPLFTVTRFEDGQLHTEHRQHLPADEVVWCLPGTASRWPSQSGLACNDRGFVQVNPQLQSVSHPFVFASSETASLADQPGTVARAAHQAAALNDNLGRYLRGDPLRSCKARKQSLNIMTCGGPYAIARRGKWVFAGKWVWRWKQWLDRRFMETFPKI